jgi:transcription initiation factor IIE alpha subunit
MKLMTSATMLCIGYRSRPIIAKRYLWKLSLDRLSTYLDYKTAKLAKRLTMAQDQEESSMNAKDEIFFFDVFA